MVPAERARRWLRPLALALATLLLAETAHRLDWLRGPEDLWYDLFHLAAGQRAQARHTALVAVDDATLLALRDDPLAFWGPHFARVMQVLEQAGAAAIGLDYIYTVSAEAWLKKLDLPDSAASRTYDVPLRAALASGRVVLISKLVPTPDGGTELLLPPQDHLLVLPGGYDDTGVSNLPGDDDGVVRHFRPAVTAQPDFPGVGFGVQLALRLAGQDPRAAAWRIAGAELARTPLPRRIGYVGPPGTVPSVSMERLLMPDALADPAVQALKGRAVIIASAESGTQDRHFTPYSRRALHWEGGMMTGGEVHANIVETLLTGRYPLPLTQPARLAWLGLLALGAAALFFRLQWGLGLLAWLGLAAACAAGGYALFGADRLAPVAAPQAAMLAAWLLATGWRLTGEERERARLRGMFGRYVSEEVVDSLLAQHHRPDLGGETVPVTVLFCDIRGFTTLSEQLTPHEVVEMLNAWFGRACAPVLEQGGTVDKYIGDAVMAVFGAPLAHPDHPRRAVAAALGIVRQAEGFREWMRERFGGRGLHDFAVGVGLHTGEAVVGNVGSERRMEFTAIGDTVNLASRLEGQCKELGWRIVASAATVDAAGAGVSAGARAVVHVKGHMQPIEVVEVLGLETPAGVN